ncbi:MAG: hypothetical protein JXQ65_15690 [Candidatus Marinimicrobia bacterium]|nr:hypothetical protein [Candidatus Neomarinimicrobiota bacterium]
MDERFRKHQLISTRIAMLAAIAVISGWFYYDLIANKIIRWDYMVVLLVAAVTKIGSMIYFRITN